MENQSHQKFGRALTGAVKTLFIRFGENIRMVALLMITAVFAAIPFILSVITISQGDGYPYLSLSAGSIVAAVLGLMLLFVGADIFVPSLLTAYVAPKTRDVMEGVSRELNERKKIMSQSFGSVFRAAFFQMMIIFVPSIVFQIVSYLILADVPLSNLLYHNETLNTILGLSALFMIVVVVLKIFTVFTRQIAFFENISGFRAVVRSVKLVSKRNFWPTLGELFLTGFATLTAVYFLLIPAVMLLSVAALIYSGTDPSMIMMIIIGLVIFVIALFGVCIYRTVQESAICRLYFNARARTEGIPIPDKDSIE